MTKSNIVPSITMDFPPLGVEVLINAMNHYIEGSIGDVTVTPDDFKLYETIRGLLVEYRNDYRRKAV